MVLLLFLLAFVVGPALFLLLERKGERVWPLALGASILIVMSLVLRKAANLDGAVSSGRLFWGLLLIWLAWILVLALSVHAIGRKYPGPVTRRWSRALGAMCTTVPWFGFAAANMMAE